MIDFINVIRGHIDTDEGLSHVIPGMGSPAAPHLAFAGEVRAALRVPTFHAARIADIATADHAIRAGLIDMVGMTRAHMADPHIVAKIMRGEEARIRPCVGVGYCIDRIYEGGEALCLHNPATGREATMPHVIARSDGPARKIVVVGAGPAGLEAARVAAARGHPVVLFEAAARPGGQVRLAAALARRREIIGIVEWLEGETRHLGVDLRCNLLAEAVRSTTRSTTALDNGVLPGGRLLSCSRPVTPAAMNRSCHRHTVALAQPTRRMIDSVPRPSALSSTMCARSTCFWRWLRPATIASSRARSAAATSSPIPLRIPAR
jgi:hypothetical protein